MRLSIRTIPWLLAVAGLGIPLAAGGFAGWPYVIGWTIALMVFAVARQRSPAVGYVVRPALLLPALIVLGFVGGWYLIPADLAWFVIELRDRSKMPRQTQSGGRIA